MMNKKKRNFNTKSKLDTQITVLKHIFLKKNQQITFVEKKKKEYDIVKKEWGYYATPSINRRLKKFGYECLIIKNRQNKFFLCIVNKDLKKKFKLYLKQDDQKIVCWLNNKNLKLIDNFFYK